MKKTLIKSSIVNLLHHPWQILLSIVGIALGVAVVVSIDLVNQSAVRAFRLSFETIAGKATHQLVGGPSGVPDSLFRIIRTDLGFRKSAPAIEGYLTIEDEPPRTLTLLGVDWFSEAPFRRNILEAETFDLKNFTKFFTEPRAVIISNSTAKNLGKKTGDPLPIKIGVKKDTLKIIGLLNVGDGQNGQALENMIIADISTAQELMGMDGHVSRIDLLIDNQQTDSILQKLEAVLPSGVRIEKAGYRTNSAEQMVSAFNMNLTAMSLLALIVGMFLIYNTMTFAVVQRRSYIGLIRSLGVTRKEIFWLIVNEALILGFIGTLIGVFAGILLSKGMIGLVTQSINDLYFVLTVNTIHISFLNLLKGFIIGIGATCFAALKPAREATLSPPRVVMSRSNLETGIRTHIPKLTIWGSFAALLGAAILFTPGKSIWVSYSGLVPLVLGLSLLTPLLIVVAVKLVRPLMGRLFGTLGKMAANGISAQISRTSVAIAALSIAVATTIGVGTMVKSFRNTVSDWLENLLSADIFISAPRIVATQSNGNLDFDLVDKFSKMPEIKHVNYYREQKILTEKGAFILLTAKIGKHRYDDFTFKSGDPDQAWQQYQENEAALVSETYAHHYDTNVGDDVILLTDHGDKKFEVVGVYYDYGTDLGLVSIAYPTYRKYWRDDKLSGILLYLNAGVLADAFMEQIRRMLPPDQEVQVQSNRSLMNSSIQVFDRTFLITSVLQSLAIIVAFVGVLSALMAIQLERTREFGVLRATGLTPKELWKMVILQTGLMGLISGLIALPIGNILALVLIKVINERSFGWTIHFDFIPGLLLQGLILAVLAAIFAGIFPAYKMAKTSPALALREE